MPSRHRLVFGRVLLAQIGCTLILGMHSDMESATKDAALCLWLHPTSSDHPGFLAKQLECKAYVAPVTWAAIPPDPCVAKQIIFISFPKREANSRSYCCISHHVNRPA